MHSKYSRRRKGGNKLFNVIIFGFVLRVGISIWNGFFGPSFGADMDALNFHLAAIDYATDLRLDDFRIGWIYSYFLGVVYFLTFKSLFLGSMLSSFVWGLSAYVLMRIMSLLSIAREHKIKVLLIYAILPSSILYTGITLREPYQMFFVNLAVYAGLKIYLEKSARHWGLLFFASIGMGILHGALLAFGLLNVGSIFIFLVFRLRNRLSPGQLMLAIVFSVIVVFLGLALFANASYNLDGGVGNAVETYQQNLIGAEARTTYSDHIQIGGISGLLLFAPKALFQYLFEPFPWHISTVADIELFFENCLRAWLIWKTWSGLRSRPPKERKPVLFVFVSYIIIEIIWSVGTANWGTAVRHHLPSSGLLLVAAFSFLGRDGNRNLQSSTM